MPKAYPFGDCVDLLDKAIFPAHNTPFVRIAKIVAHFAQKDKFYFKMKYLLTYHPLIHQLHASIETVEDRYAGGDLQFDHLLA